MQQKGILTWNAPSSPQRHRSLWWYIVFSVIMFALAAIAIGNDDWTFAILLILCVLVYIILHNHTPGEMAVTVFPQGILIDQWLLRWSDCTGFWLGTNPHYTTLYIEWTDQKKTRLTKVIIGSTDPLILMETLSEFLPEIPGKGEGFIDNLTRLCKL